MATIPVVQLKDKSLAEADTGAMLPNNAFNAILFKKIKYEENFIVIFQNSRILLAKDKELRGGPRAVLDYLEAITDFDNKIIISQTEIAKELNIGRNKVSAAIKMLLKKEIITKGPKSGCSWSYKLNPMYAWKGYASNNIKERRNKEKHENK